MKTLLVEAPINSLSFGNVSYNILREFSKRGIEVGLFPTGNVDVSAYKADASFSSWIKESIDKRWDIVASKAPSFKLWHLNGALDRKSHKQNLLTFYETSEPTFQEVSTCKSQDRTLFSSTCAKDLFESAGCSNCSFVPMGFDQDFFKTGKKYLEGVVHFGLMGKFEKRKHTEKIIRAWLKKYGNDNRYQLSCCVTNPFFKPEQMQAVIASVLEGKRYTNINFLPYLKTNSEVNEFLNAVDIDLSGLSGSEGWGLCSFNSTCLGKWSIVANHTAHKDWATSCNSILIEPNGTMSSVDGVFFSEGQQFNQGVFYTWDENDAISAMDLAVGKVGLINQKGVELGKKMTYENTVNKIIESFY